MSWIQRSQSWEAKLAVSGVANFEEDAAMAPFAKHARQQQQASAAQAAPSTSRPAARGSSNAPQSGGSGNQSSSAHQNAKASSSSKSKTEEPEDEDELGSDLDDPEDDADAGQDGTAGIDSGDFIIALYEKVRAKGAIRLARCTGAHLGSCCPARSRV